MLKKIIADDLKKAVEQAGYPAGDIVLSISKNPIHGDYTTNVALQLAKQQVANSHQSADEIANKILQKFGKPDYLQKVEIAGNGFINFFISDKNLIDNADGLDVLQKGERSQNILVEYGHVNPLKEIHIGHIRTFTLGESICRILDSLGNQVFRANYQGDIGLHIAKAIWGVRLLGLPATELNLEEKAKFLGSAYAKGNTSYDEDPGIKKEIDEINVALYKKDPKLKEIYDLTRNWSLEYFEPIYKLLGVKYDRYFFESEVFENGKQIVMDNIGKVFEESDGAVIFPGEKYGLHNRVFITSAGNPTYEGKEIGLAQLEYDTFNYDKAIHVVASEQDGYFQVVIKAIDEIFPYLKGKKHHLSYGIVDLKEGKMSSRTGNVITANDLYHIVSEKVREVMKQTNLEIDQETVRKVALGAIKFAYLKFSPNPNIVFDLEQSVSLDGDSGPYVQYTYARIQSILRKTEKDMDKDYVGINLEKQERALLRQLLYFQETIEEIAINYHPNLLALYLIDLARAYNLFYQECRVIGSEKESFRLKLSSEVAKVLSKGLNLLGIEAPEKM